MFSIYSMIKLNTEVIWPIKIMHYTVLVFISCIFKMLKYQNSVMIFYLLMIHCVFHV